MNDGTVADEALLLLRLPLYLPPLLCSLLHAFHLLFLSVLIQSSIFSFIIELRAVDHVTYERVYGLIPVESVLSVVLVWYIKRLWISSIML